jgi:hypothetical protein
MLTAIQIPFADARPFLESGGARLHSPGWPFPETDLEFVRSFGVTRKRRRGGIPEWPGEEVYCEARGAVRFAPGAHGIVPDDDEGQVLHPSCAFRRLLTDGRFGAAGGVVSRFEAGFTFRRKKPRPLSFNGESALAVVRAVLETKVTVQGSAAVRRLFQAGPELAQLWLKSTTGHPADAGQAPALWSVRSGTPLVVVEYLRSEDIQSLPEHTRFIQIFQKSGIELGHCRVECHGARLGVWFLGTDREGADEGVLRRLRLALFRLHAEQESLKHILRLAGQERLGAVRGSEFSERLQTYLQDALRMLTRQDRAGLPQSELLDAAQQLDELVTAGERATLLQQLSSIRRNLLRRLERLTEPPEQRQGVVYNITAPQIIIYQEQNGSTTVNNQNINFGSGNVFHGDVNVVAAKTIQDSFNRLAASNASPDLRAALEALHKTVAELGPRLPAAQQTQVAKDLETLSSEATSEAPRRAWYELSGKGLVEAAKAVGEFAAPVATAVGKVLALLG